MQKGRKVWKCLESGVRKGDVSTREGMKEWGRRDCRNNSTGEATRVKSEMVKGGRGST